MDRWMDRQRARLILVDDTNRSLGSTSDLACELQHGRVSLGVARTDLWRRRRLDLQRQQEARPLVLGLHLSRAAGRGRLHVHGRPRCRLP